MEMKETKNMKQKIAEGLVWVCVGAYVQYIQPLL